MQPRHRILLPLLLLAAMLAQPSMAVDRVPYPEIVDTVQSLAAEILGRKKAEISTIDSLFVQGMRENQFDALVVAVQDEFGVVLPVDEIQHAKFNDPAVRLSIRRLASLVEKQMRQSPPF